MKYFKIGLDMDGVTCDLLTHMIYLLNRYHGENLKKSDITSWGIEDHCKNVKKKHIAKYIDEPGFFRHLEPMEGALEYIEKLHNNGHEIYFITACNSGGFDCKRAWITKNLPFVPDRNFFGTKSKEMVKVDIFMDDKLDNLIAYHRAWPETPVFAFDQPYNQDWLGFRALGWADFYETVTKLALDL